MIQVKNPDQIKAMRVAGRITGEAILVAQEMIREGVTTKQIDDRIRQYIEKCGAKPSFLGYAGFPGSACISINDEVIHGIPSAKRYLHEGDIVKIDVGAYIGGFHGDSANTFGVGKISDDAQRLIDVTRQSFEMAIRALEVPNARIGDIGNAIQTHVEKNGYSVVRQYIGHGVGHELHEQPDVPNFGIAGRGLRLTKGMTIAIEPMVNAGAYQVRQCADGWTVVTADGSLSAHYEHSVALTEEGPILLTKV
ncbi:MAG: type I methionyl aminopeptidase [Clostridia bacterium]|nr:type I methionyl aminopeptidase [Clostridia bacterium]